MKLNQCAGALFACGGVLFIWSVLLLPSAADENRAVYPGGIHASHIPYEWAGSAPYRPVEPVDIMALVFAHEDMNRIIARKRHVAQRSPTERMRWILVAVPNVETHVYVEGAGYLRLRVYESEATRMVFNLAELRQSLRRARDWARVSCEPLWIESGYGEIMALIDYSEERGPIYAKL